MRSTENGLIRGRLTYLLYLLAGIFGLTLGAFGSAMPLMRVDVGMTRAVGGLHFTMLAAGAVVSGFVTDLLTERWGRRRVTWLGAFGVAAGAALVAGASGPTMSLVGAALIGVTGSSVLVAAASSLADIYPENRAVVLTEMNTANSLGTVIPALVVGGSVAAGLSWRSAFVLPGLVLLLSLVFLRSVPFPTPKAPGSGSNGKRLPAQYWFLWAGVVPAVAAEWSIGAWGAGYLVDVGQASEELAALAIALFFGMIVVGRTLGSLLARWLVSLTLVVAGAATALVGTILLRATDELTLMIVALGVSGLGISVLFPMLLTMAVEATPSRADLAAARLSVAAGGAVIVAPLTLGFIADQQGIRSAFEFVPGLFGLLLGLVLIGRLFVGRRRGLP